MRLTVPIAYDSGFPSTFTITESHTNRDLVAPEGNKTRNVKCSMRTLTLVNCSGNPTVQGYRDYFRDSMSYKDSNTLNKLNSESTRITHYEVDTCIPPSLSAENEEEKCGTVPLVCLEYGKITYGTVMVEKVKYGPRLDLSVNGNITLTGLPDGVEVTKDNIAAISRLHATSVKIERTEHVHDMFDPTKIRKIKLNVKDTLETTLEAFRPLASKYGRDCFESLECLDVSCYPMTFIVKFLEMFNITRLTKLVLSPNGEKVNLPQLTVQKLVVRTPTPEVNCKRKDAFISKYYNNEGDYSNVDEVHYKKAVTSYENEQAPLIDLTHLDGDGVMRIKYNYTHPSDDNLDGEIESNSETVTKVYIRVTLERMGLGAQ